MLPHSIPIISIYFHIIIQHYYNKSKKNKIDERKKTAKRRSSNLSFARHISKTPYFLRA